MSAPPPTSRRRHAALAAYRGKFRANRGGFTMAELVVVLAITALMTAMAVPHVVSYLEGAKLRAAAEQIAASLRLARHLAIAGNQNVCVETTATTLRYRMANCAGPAWTGPGTDSSGTIAAPAGVSLRATASPVFSHLGSASPAATYTVADSQFARQLHVTVAASGRVRVGP